MEKMYLKFNASSKNESFARTCVSAFILPLNPSVEELSDIKTAVSEAVTNAVVHAYPKNKENSEIIIECFVENNTLHIKITDFGQGIENVENALEPFFTTREEDERAGMGFTIMRTFMDTLSVESVPQQGTIVNMSKLLKAG
ncbi:MAG: anti-sigma F factor [Clostridia bacterium]|nr:anti-sigma F factor [Clostridia bacterium]